MNAVEPIDGSTATPAELRRAGLEALVRALGPVGMARFFQQFGLGRGDYTAERDRILGNPTVDELVDELERRRGNLRGSDCTCLTYPPSFDDYLFRVRPGSHTHSPQSSLAGGLTVENHRQWRALPISFQVPVTFNLSEKELALARRVIGAPV